MNSKIQAATEYLMIVGFVIVILVPGIYLYMKYSQESQDSIINAKVDAITNEIIKAAEQVYSYGEGSQTKLTIDLPKSVKLIEFQDNEVIFTVVNSKGAESEIAKVASVKLEGVISLIPGTKSISIKSFGDFVSVYVECILGNRCGTEWECNYYELGNACTMSCINNQWVKDDSCPYGCDEGVCAGGGQQGYEECEGDETACQDETTLLICIENYWQQSSCANYCENGACVECLSTSDPTCDGQTLLTCIEGEWQGVSCMGNCFEGECVDCNIDGDCAQGKTCVNHVCVCNEGEKKCEISPNCGLDPSCVKECQNNQWVITTYCKNLTPSCSSSYLCVCTEASIRCGGFSECVNRLYPCRMKCQASIWTEFDSCLPLPSCELGACI